jgi:hypothetical protein
VNAIISFSCNCALVSLNSSVLKFLFGKGSLSKTVDIATLQRKLFSWSEGKGGLSSRKTLKINTGEATR